MRAPPPPSAHSSNCNVRLAAAKRPPPAPCRQHRALHLLNLLLACRRAPSTCSLPVAKRPPPEPCLQHRALHLHLASLCSAPASPSDLSKLKFKSTQRARLCPADMRPTLLLCLNRFYTSTFTPVFDPFGRARCPTFKLAQRKFTEQWSR
jgi:hypothetical protein